MSIFLTAFVAMLGVACVLAGIVVAVYMTTKGWQREAPGSRRTVLAVGVALAAVVVIAASSAAIYVISQPKQQQAAIHPSPTVTVGPPGAAGTPGAPGTAGTPAAAYTADWSAGLDGWSGAAEYTAQGGMLVSSGNASCRGDDRACAIFAPYVPPSTDYLVQARVHIDSVSQGALFGIWVRATPDGSGGYLYWDEPTSTQPPYAGNLKIAFPTYAYDPIQEAAYSPGSAWHIYAIEAVGDKITAFIDGTQILQVDNSATSTAGQIALAGGLTQIQVSSLSVTLLP